MKIGENVKIARKNAGLTQAKLAELAGIGRRTLIKIEDDELKTSLVNVHNIAHACGVSLNFLAYGSEKQTLPCAVFQDQAKGEALIKKLQDLEKKAPHIYEMVDTYIAGTYDTAKAVSEDWSRIAPTEEQKQENTSGLGKLKTGTDSS